MLIAWLAVCAAPLLAATRADEASWEAKLQTDLATRGLRYRLRAPRANATVVKFKLIVKSFHFDVGEEQINIHTWMVREWNDPRLTWDPSAYGDIDMMQISSSHIWIPRLRLRNGVSTYRIGTEAECVVQSSGALQCKSKELFAVLCSWTRFAAWPYDTRTCSFVFGNEDKFRDDAMFTFDGRGVNTLVAEYGPIWNIIDYEHGEEAGRDQRGQRLHFTLTLERQGAALAALAAAPALAASALTVAAAGLPVRYDARTALAVLSLAAHYAVLQIINESVPQHGRDSPSMLRYVTGSIAVTAMTLVATFALGRLPRAGREAPQWVWSLNAMAARAPFGLAAPVLRGRPATVLDAALGRHETEWLDFVSICSCLLFIVVVVVLVSLYFSYVPGPLPIQ